MWRYPAEGHDAASYNLVFQDRHHVYQIGFPATGVNSGHLEKLLNSLLAGGGGITELPVDLPAGQSLMPKVASCSNCSDSDTSTNPYPCCSRYGNCTWKAEQIRPGSNNFSFQNTSGRHAYRWMSLARAYTGYAQGGTIPVPGAVLVAISAYGGYGHVGTVKSIGTDGSVAIVEQNCNVSCTRTKSYSAQWLRANLAGYIYEGTSAPTPKAKVISKTGSTTMEDFNFSNVYNFTTYGPGSPMSFNSDERAWGTSDKGSNSYMHFVRSKTGSTENYGRWRASIQEAGSYDVHAWIPDSQYSGATAIQYEVGGVLTARINQSTNRGKWVKLTPASGGSTFRATSSGVYSVYLKDNANSTSGQWIAFDAVKFTRK